MAEKISPQGMPKTSEHKSSPPTELPSPLNDVAPPSHSAADTLGPPPVPFSAHQVPGVPPVMTIFHISRRLLRRYGHSCSRKASIISYN